MGKNDNESFKIIKNKGTLAIRLKHKIVCNN